MNAERDNGEPQLRDILAAIAMHAAMSGAAGLGDMNSAARKALLAGVASITYEMADAMLVEKERAK